MNTKPSRGPYHFRAPSKVFFKAVRGMVPHKLSRGKASLANLKVFDGIPAPYDKKKRMVVPSALKVLRLNPRRKSCQLGRLSHEVGWHYQDTIATLESKRKEQSAKFYEKKKTTLSLRKKAAENKAAKLAQYDKVLEQHGFL